MGQWRVIAMKEFISISAKDICNKNGELTNDYEICGDFPSCSVLKASKTYEASMAGKHWKLSALVQ